MILPVMLGAHATRRRLMTPKLPGIIVLVAINKVPNGLILLVTRAQFE